MNTKNVSFWLLLAGGVIVVSIAAWFIGNSVAGIVLNNRGAETVQTGKPTPGLEDKDSDRDPDGEELSLGGNIEDDAEPAEDEETTDPEDDETEDAATDTAAATEPIPSADSVTDSKPAADAPAADDSGDELFGGSVKPAGGATDPVAAKPADKTTIKPAEKPALDATAKKILYRVQIGAFSNRENAAAYAEEAAVKTGLPASAIKDPSSSKGIYRVQCGAFSDKERAQNLMRELELQGYQVHMSETPLD